MNPQDEGPNDERTDGAPAPQEPVDDAAAPEQPVAPSRTRGGRMEPLSDARRQQVLDLRAEGLSLAAIGRQLGLPKSTVQKAARRGVQERQAATEVRSSGGAVEKVDAQLGAAAAGVPVDDAVTEASQAARVRHLERLEAEDHAKTLMAQAQAAETQSRLDRLADLRLKELSAVTRAAELGEPTSEGEREEYRRRNVEIAEQIAELREARHAIELEAAETRHRQERAADRQEMAQILKRIEDRPTSDSDMSFWKETLDKAGEGIAMVFSQIDRRIDRLAETGQLPAFPAVPPLPKLEPLPQVDWSKQSDQDMKGYADMLGVDSSDPKEIRAELGRRQKTSLKESRAAAGQVRDDGYRSI